MLYQTRALDPAIYAVVTATLLAVSALACLVPAGARPGSILRKRCGRSSRGTNGLHKIQCPYKVVL